MYGVRSRFRAPERDAVTLTESEMCWSPLKMVKSPLPHIKDFPQLVKLNAKKKKLCWQQGTFLDNYSVSIVIRQFLTYTVVGYLALI